MAKVTWHGHATCTLETDGGTRAVIDPFFGDNPACSVGVDEVGDVDYILVTHGHFDHFADCVPLARRTGAMVVSTFEIASFLGSEKGVENTHGMNIGGGHAFGGLGYVKLTPAVHTGSVAGDAEGAYTTDCAGFLLELDGTRFHHSGDTALIKDMELLRGRVDVAMLPIGDNYTMGPEDAARAVEMIGPRVVIPIHYGTWPVIEQDPEEFRRLVGDRAEVVVLEPGDSYDL
ncbi:MAG TPA: metal-dependent hydrolase [Longimicrobiales bacterium]|nr:metal-dependent hydrolase [Longimicrobiales bacterium]